MVLLAVLATTSAAVAVWAVVAAMRFARGRGGRVELLYKLWAATLLLLMLEFMIVDAINVT
jgi:hypothetical protein